MSDTTETPLDAIARRAKALGWKVKCVSEPLLPWWRLVAVTTPSGRHRSYSERKGEIDEVHAVRGSDLCPHERALLEADGAALDALRALHGQLAQAEALVADMRAQIERLIGLVTGGGA